MVRPKKHLGQHFLTDHNIARKITDQLSYHYPVLEIGPGKGILTTYILQKNHSAFKLVDIDEESVDFLKQEFPQITHDIVLADILDTDLKKLFDNQISIIGNFPYNISSQIFFKVLNHRDQVAEVVCMIQKEVARRIASGHGSKEYGILSVLLQTFYQVEYLFSVGEKVFYPRPKVQSAVIKLTRKDNITFPFPDAHLIKVVKTAFNQRRKTLRNALKGIITEKVVIPDTYLDRRAEALSVDEFQDLALRLWI